MITTKQKALWSGVIAAASGFLAWLANTPPEQQDALLGPLVNSLPVTWRPSIGAAMKLLSSIAIIYSTVQASHAGPTTPPVNNSVGDSGKVPLPKPAPPPPQIEHKTIGTD